MNPLTRLLIRKILIAACVVLAAITAAGWYGYWLAIPHGERAAAFSIDAGESGDAVAQGLKDAGVIRSVWLFKIALRRSGLAAKLQPGIYNLTGVRTYDDIPPKLVTGGVSAREVVIRVIEGWDLNDIHDRLTQLGAAAAAKFFDVTGEPGKVYKAGEQLPLSFTDEFTFLNSKPAIVSLEGYLFPDTYRLFKDAAPEDIVRTLLTNFRRHLTPDMEAKIQASGRTVHQVLTVASIVEKEVSMDVDRRMVADIFWRRLDAGQPLQADSTVNYATGRSARAVSWDDTQYDSLYNTYKYAGLPPGPICDPGLSAIEAAIDPTPNEFNYFLTDNDGTVHYARTYAEQNRNKGLYIK